MIYNLLNFPAGVVPVSTVTAQDEEELCHYQGLYHDIFDMLFKEVRHAFDFGSSHDPLLSSIRIARSDCKSGHPTSAKLQQEHRDAPLCKTHKTQLYFV